MMCLRGVCMTTAGVALGVGVRNELSVDGKCACLCMCAYVSLKCAQNPYFMYYPSINACL